MRYFHIVFSFLLIISIKSDYKPLNKEEFYNKVRNQKYGKQFYIDIIDNLEKILNYYVYIELFKNPPQPIFDSNYFPKVDTIKSLEEIKSKVTEETNAYDFYRDLKLLIDSYKDAHMTYGFRQGFDYQKYAFLCPLSLTTKINANNEIYSTGEMIFDESFFRNGTEIAKIINKNKDVPIRTINNKTPFEFLQTFGNPFMQLKNIHATYTFKLHQYLSPFVLYFPLNSEDISFKVEYENGDKFETDFSIVEIVNNNENNNDNNNYKFFNNENNEKEFLNYLEQKLEENYGVPKSLNEIINDFENYKKIGTVNNLLNKKNNFIFQNILSESENTELKWDYEYIKGGDSIFQCRVDIEKNVNVYHLKSFDFNNIDEAFNILKNCINLFSSNNYNIIVILNYNGGGSELFSQTMVEYLQPFISSRFYSTFKQGKYLKTLSFNDHSVRETCKIPDIKYILGNTISIDYGNNIINNITLPLTRFGQYRNEFNKQKKLIKNKRKPTEILIFTDSYSASAASLFCKSLQYEGGAIVVGYNGNPESDNIFDSSQHFSTIINWDNLKKIEPEATNKLDQLGIKFSQICITNNYLNYSNLKVPEEFNVISVDYVSNIYESYDENKNYDLFIEKGKEILEKFKTDCNKNNNKLVLFNENCKFKNDKYAHGGFGCGEDGKWDEKKCIPVYCDEGYFFDNVENKCVKDPCIEEKEEEDKNEEKDESFSKRINIRNIIIITAFFLILF